MFDVFPRAVDKIISGEATAEQAMVEAQREAEKFELPPKAVSREA